MKTKSQSVKVLLLCNIMTFMCSCNTKLHIPKNNIKIENTTHPKSDLNRNTDELNRQTKERTKIPHPWDVYQNRPGKN